MARPLGLRHKRRSIPSAPFYHLTTADDSSRPFCFFQRPRRSSSLNFLECLRYRITAHPISGIGPSSAQFFRSSHRVLTAVLTDSHTLLVSLLPPRHLAIEARPRTASTWLKLAEKVEEMLTGTHHRRTSAASSAISPGRDSDLHRISVRIDTLLRPVCLLPMAYQRKYSTSNA